MICSECDKPITSGSAVIDGDRVCIDCVIGAGKRAAGKFGNQRTEYRGRTYASRAEADRAAELDMLRATGAILEFGVQPRFALGCDVNVYVADFLVTDLDGTSHVEDVKGMPTPKFRRDCRLWRLYGPHPLVILTRSAPGWSRTIIWPDSLDRSRYRTDDLA